ncbi:MAG: hypothetical protein J6A37_05485 [Oscillospiraceae bacterium]|nr:hypothetical protein [Oscillospiraceae bacterium]
MSENNKDGMEEVMEGVAKGCGFLFKSVGTVALGAVGLLGGLGEMVTGMKIGIGEMSMDAIDAIWSGGSTSPIKAYDAAVRTAMAALQFDNEHSYEVSKDTAWKAYKTLYEDTNKDEDALYREFERRFECDVERKLREHR